MIDRLSELMIIFLKLVSVYFESACRFFEVRLRSIPFPLQNRFIFELQFKKIINRSILNHANKP